MKVGESRCWFSPKCLLLDDDEEAKAENVLPKLEFFRACASGDLSVVLARKDLLSETDEQGNTAFHYAAYGGEVILRCFCSYGFDIKFEFLRRFHYRMACSFLVSHTLSCSIFCGLPLFICVLLSPAWLYRPVCLSLPLVFFVSVVHY